MYESSKCEFSSFTVKSQPINTQLQVEGKCETPNIMRSVKTSMPLTLSWWYLYMTDIATWDFEQEIIEHYPLFLIAG